jgi:hypothetical protein
MATRDVKSPARALDDYAFPLYNVDQYAARLLPPFSGFKGAFSRELPRNTAPARDAPGEAPKRLMVDRGSGGIAVRRTGNLVPEESDNLHSGHAVGVPLRLSRSRRIHCLTPQQTGFRGSIAAFILADNVILTLSEGTFPRKVSGSNPVNSGCFSSGESGPEAASWMTLKSVPSSAAFGKSAVTALRFDPKLDL